jgi:hypothetical protein
MTQYRLGVKRDFTGVHANRDSDLGGFLAGNMQALLSKVPPRGAQRCLRRGYGDRGRPGRILSRPAQSKSGVEHRQGRLLLIRDRGAPETEKATTNPTGPLGLAAATSMLAIKGEERRRSHSSTLKSALPLIEYPR